MSDRFPVFEAEVEVTKKGTEKYRIISWDGTHRSAAVVEPVGYGNIRERAKPIGMYVAEKIVRMFHIENVRTHKQARAKASKYGRVISVRKVNEAELIEKLAERAESLPLGGMPNPYPNAIAMDELIWQRKDKRASRIQDRQLDKE